MVNSFWDPCDNSAAKLRLAFKVILELATEIVSQSSFSARSSRATHSLDTEKFIIKQANLFMLSISFIEFDCWILMKIRALYSKE